MNIFKNLSNAEKKKVVNQCKKINYQVTDHAATNMHWLAWDKDTTDDYCKANNYPIISKIVSGCEKWDLIENPYTKEDCLKVVKIAKLRNKGYDMINPIKYGDALYNADYIALGYSFMNPKNKIMVRKRANRVAQSGEIIEGALYITDGEINFMLMPIHCGANKEGINPDSISLEDVEKARKYKLHLSKSHDPEYTNFSEKNILVSRGEYFVIIPKSNKFLREVFDCESDKPEDYSDGDILFEVDENQTKHTEDLFHKKVVYAKAVQGYGRDREFYHLYENGCGVCFKAEV